MFKFIFYFVLIIILLFVAGFGFSNFKAKRDFVAHLNKYHHNKYDILTFKRNFNAANMNPNLYWVELVLKENRDIVINFEWNAKSKDLHFSFHSSRDRGIEALTRYQKQAIVLQRELHELLRADVYNLDVNVYNHTIDISLKAEPTLKDFQYFSDKICSLLVGYPETWMQEAHVNFKLIAEIKGFYELIVKPRTIDDSSDSFIYRHNAIITNNYGSEKAERIDAIVQKEFSKTDSPAYLHNIWVHQSQLDSFYIAFEKHEHLKESEGNVNLTKGVGMGLVKMNYPKLELETYTHYDYKTTPRDGIYMYLISQLPEDYQYLIADS